MSHHSAKSKFKAKTSSNTSSKAAAQVEALFQQGFQLFQRGQLAAAKTAFEQVLQQQPRHCNALYLLGAIAAQSQNPALAVDLISRAIDIVPSFAEGHYNLSVALMELQRPEQARASCDRAISLKPDYADAHYNRCLALQKLQQPEEAMAGYQRLLALHPGHVDACFNLGNLHRERQQWEQALACYDQALASQSDHTEAYLQRGNVLLKLRRPQEAVASFDRVLALDPQHLDAQWRRGNALMDLNQWSSALGCYDQVIAQKPDNAHVRAKRAEAFWHLGRIDQALQESERAIALKPDYAEAWCVHGSALIERNQWQVALRSFDQAIAISPDFADAWFNKSLALLVGGQFQPGWQMYEWRWKAEGGQRTFAQPVWTGAENLSGKTILLHCEQGFGDSIQFCRYAALVKQLGARVLLGVPPKLTEILANLEGVDEVLQHGNVLPAFDYHCPFLSLPLAFKTELHSIPNPGPYVQCSAGQRSAWQQRLGDSGRPRVGLVWRGNAVHKNDRNRSLPLAELLAHLPPGLDYVSVQQELPEADLQLLRAHGIKHSIRHFGEQLHDFSDTAALCDLMDLVVSVDTSVAHLAAAMGKPTWILLPYTPDWRWLLDRDDSPWYPTVRLYRQAERRQWRAVLERVAQDLRQVAGVPSKAALPAPEQQIAALIQQGFELHQQGRLAEAKAVYEQVLKQQPQHVDALHLLGAIASQSGNPSLALELMEQAIAINPGFAELHINRAVALTELGRFGEALGACERALAQKPNSAEACCKRGLALHRLQRLDEALLSYDRALTLKPDYAEAWSNRADLLMRLCQPQQALASCDQAIAVQANYVNAHYNRGIALQKLQRLDEALLSFDRAIALQPTFAKAYLSKSLALLLGGQFRQGWELYAWRWQGESDLRPKPYAQAIWTGKEPLSGKTILLHGEQGLGDTIQFIRYAKLVKQRGATVLLGVPQAIAGLLAGVDGVDALVASDQPLPAFDCHCPLLSLPLAFGTELHSIPNPGAYLRSSAEQRSQWNQRLGAKTKLRVGLAWRGSQGHKDDHYRSLPLVDLLQHLPEGMDYVSLQKELPEADLRLLQGSGIRHYGDGLQDFGDTAALCDLMDLVLAVDTSVAHLAAAMGKVSWIMLPFGPDWRWLLERSDSPWYPTVRLYRQAEPGQWQLLLERVAEDLLGLQAQHGQSASQAISEPDPQVRAIFQQALQLHRQGQLASAQWAYEAVLKQQPHHFDALQLLGALAGQSNKPALAAELLGRALAIHPGSAHTHTNLAIALLELNRREEALSSCDRAIAQQPDFADAHTNRGLALLSLGWVEEALACHEQAIAIKPDYADAHSNRGAALYELKRWDDALASYDQAIAINPHHANARFNKSLILLVCGQFVPGWEQYAWRLKVQKQARTFQQPVWTGAENLHGKTILLHGEQGLGDSIQFCRYAKLVQQLGARVLLEVPAQISALLRDLPGVDLLLETGEPLPPFDCHCPLLSLPLVFRTELHSIPSPGPYLHSRADKRSQWRQRLGEKKNLRVGLVWRGNPAHVNDLQRSLPLAELLPHLPSAIDYVSLQKNLSAAELQLLGGSNIQHVGEQLRDFSDTAALCDLLDIVLAVDTSVAHLAAAMGKATWILLPYAPEWRWLLDRSDSPWYATATLYRQTERRAWKPVLERVAHDLQQVHHSANTFQQGRELHRQGQLERAKACFQQVLQREPTHVEALHWLGVLALQCGHHAQALEWMDRALAINPAHAQAQFHRGMVFLALGQLEQALGSLEQSLSLQAENEQAHFYRGVVLHRLSRVEQAIAAYDQAIAHKPDHARAFNNRGLALQKLLRLEEALASYDQAIAIAPDFAEAHSRRGVTLVKCNQLEPALRSFDRAIALDPDYHETWFNKAMALLIGGQWEQGWQLYEWRWKGERAASAPGPFQQPLWLGAENLAGKTILLIAEQGLGDCIQFCRYARLVKQRGARVLLQVPTPLLALLRGLDGVDVLVEQGAPLPVFDYYCPLLSLPLAFKTGLHSIPDPGPYLHSRADKRLAWQHTLGEKKKPRVGLVWRGRAEFQNDYNRSLPLPLLLQHLPADVDYVSLQKDVTEADRQLLQGRAIPHYGELLHDFSDTAALCDLVDLVLTVDTSVAHLAAAMGKTTWIVLPYAPDWRWLLNRDDSPWYPSARLYRQTQPGQWGPVLERVAPDLQQVFAAAGQPVLALPAEQVEAVFEHGFRLHQNGQLAQAQAAYAQVLAMQPRHADALHLLGAIAVQSHNPALAVQRMEQAVAIKPRFVEAHTNLAAALLELKRPLDALASCNRAIAIRPDYADAWSNRGLALQQLQRPQEALPSYDQALALQPRHVDALCNRGTVLVQLHRLDEALLCYDQALAIDPACVEAFCNRGIAHKKRHRYADALADYEQALAIAPRHLKSLLNRGLVLQNMQRLPEALDSFDQALAMEPGYVNAYFSKSLTHLLAGQLQQGWQLYEWRWQYEGGFSPRPFAQAQWSGAENLLGKTILLHAEQGLGDCLQFCRYAKLVKSLGAKVLLEVPPPLGHLLATLEGVDELLVHGQPLPAFDFHCPLLSLPRAFQTALDSIPSSGAYVQSGASQRKQWSQRLGAKTRPRVGLAWTGSALHQDDQNRSLPLASLLPYLPGNLNYVSLQKEVTEADRQLLQDRAIPHYGELLHDFSDTAALCDLVDLVLTVDTSVAHLAAAMGKTTWIVLPYAPDWRWLLNRDDSPWYPSARLYRQTQPGQWGPVLERVAKDLASIG